MEERACPGCGQVWHTSSWRGPVRVRCDCGEALNLAEAQLDRQLVDECLQVAEDLKDYLAARRGLSP